MGGRNRKVAEAFAKNGGKRLSFTSSSANLRLILRIDVSLLFVNCRSFDDLEAEMLQGQKLQVDAKSNY